MHMASGASRHLAYARIASQQDECHCDCMHAYAQCKHKPEPEPKPVELADAGMLFVVHP